MKFKKIVFGSIIISGIILILFTLLIYAITFHPKDVQAERIFGAEKAPILKSGDSLKALSFNVQYMAGKNYVFWYDMPGNKGPDYRPSPEHITQTIEEVARIIREENPDIILLQEMHENAVRTYHEDQLARLLPLLPDDYICHTSAFYWKNYFVPYIHIMGSVGMKLSTISKYKIIESTRHQLPLFPKDILTRQFYLKRAVLETRFRVVGGEDFVVLNTHLDAFSYGTDLLQKQINKVDQIINRINKEGHPWIIGGDFNILPPGLDVQTLPEYIQPYYRPENELSQLYDKYQAVPNKENVTGPNRAKWFTHLANHPAVTAPNKTIDYFFLSNEIQIYNSYVRQHDTLEISDHLPVIVEFRLP